MVVLFSAVNLQVPSPRKKTADTSTISLRRPYFYFQYAAARGVALFSPCIRKVDDDKIVLNQMMAVSSVSGTYGFGVGVGVALAMAMPINGPTGIPEHSPWSTRRSKKKKLSGERPTSNTAFIDWTWRGTAHTRTCAPLGNAVVHLCISLSLSLSLSLSPSLSVSLSLGTSTFSPFLLSCCLVY